MFLLFLLLVILVCVKAGCAMQLVVKPHQVMVKEKRLACGVIHHCKMCWHFAFPQVL
jgi:hypothetical protein